MCTVWVCGSSARADKAEKQTIEAGDIASAVEEENRVRKLKEYEALRDQLLNLKKEHEKD